MQSPDPDAECRKCMGMDPPRARYITPMEGQFNHWQRLLNLQHIGVRLNYSDLTERDIDGMLIVKASQSKADDKRRRAKEKKAR